MKNKKREKGFTLIELLVVLSIISLIFAIIMIDYRSAERQFALQRSAHKLTQDIRIAQNMAMATKEIRGLVPEGFGIYFDAAAPGQYILFADFEGNGIYSPGNEIEILEFEKKVNLKNLSPASPLNVVFYPPEPSVLISGNPLINSASIFLNYGNESAEKRIYINKAGLIEVQ